jgi:uncharacterized protein HemX
MMLVVTAIVAAAGLATVVFAVPQVKVHRHNHHYNNHNGIKVNLQVNQED